MKFGLTSLIPQSRHVLTSELPGQYDCLRRAIGIMVFAEELGFDACGIGERHDLPYLSSAPAVVLAAIAEKTSRIRLLTSVAVIGALDPVRVAEDYATVDQLSHGRLDFMIGVGSNSTDVYGRVGLDSGRRRQFHQEKYELLRRLWREENVTWAGAGRAPLNNVTVAPSPFNGPPRIWHGSATSLESVELAARWGDPIFTENSSMPTARYVALIDHYRQCWADYGYAADDAVVGAGSGGFYVARTSQEALSRYRPYYEASVQAARARGKKIEFESLEDKMTTGSALVGSPAQIAEKIHELHGLLGHQVQVVNVEVLTPQEQRATLELFMSEVAPALRAQIPTAVWDCGPVSPV